MTDDALSVLTLVSALGCGLIAGVFFAFSTFVMKALARIPAPQGIAAMQSINIVVINPWFLGPFLGTAAACAVVAVWSLIRWEAPGGAPNPDPLGLGTPAAYRLAGSLIYVVGTFLVTMVFNVPRNNALAKVDPASDDGARLWSGYLRTWTAWNHVRTTAALAAAALLTIALPE